MGCDDYPTLGDGDIIGGRYRLVGEPVAVQWNAQLAQLFPNADHHGCRQEMQPGPLVEAPFAEPYRRWAPFNPPRCHGYHCPRCGAATGSFGHRDCEGRP